MLNSTISVLNSSFGSEPVRYIPAGFVFLPDDQKGDEVKYVSLLAAAALFCIYALGNIPPSERFNLWLVPFVIPFALVVNVVLIAVGVVLRKKWSLLMIAALLFGWEYVASTVAIKSILKGSADGKETVTVLSYNVGSFHTGFLENGRGSKWVMSEARQSEMINWVLDSGADIQCFQEFPPIIKREKRNLLEDFKSRGYDAYFSGQGANLETTDIGLLIVSRFPIVNTGDILVSPNGYNRIAYADLLVRGDTLRVINSHLQSMQLKGYNPRYSPDFDSQKRRVGIVLTRLKSGVFQRSKQIKELLEFIEASPYPVICAGDFNEIPYSYSYRRLKKGLRNSFEEAGAGFGFTYNGNTLVTLRIDNQFYSDRVDCVELETLNTVSYSDHFPLLGTYVLSGGSEL